MFESYRSVQGLRPDSAVINNWALFAIVRQRWKSDPMVIRFCMLGCGGLVACSFVQRQDCEF